MRRNIPNKHYFNKLASLLILGLTLIGKNSFAQSAYGELRGEIRLESLEFDSFWDFTVTSTRVILYRDDNSQVRSTRPEFGGEFYFKKLAPGNYYTIMHLDRYRSDTSLVYTVSPDVLTRMQGITLVDSRLTIGIGGRFTGSRQDNPPPRPPGQDVIKPEIIMESSNGTNIADGLINYVPGLIRDRNNRISIIGSRPDATISTLDGGYLRTRAVPNTFSVGQVGVNAGGIPAQFGDFTGGVISYSTKAIGRKPHQLLDFNSSSPFNNYHQNSLEFFTSGPLWTKNKGKDLDSNGSGGEQMILGYFFDSRITYDKEPNPSAIGYQIVKPEALQELIDKPLVTADGGQGFLPAGTFLKQEDIITVKARPDANQFTYNGQGKLVFSPNYNSRLTWYGSVNYQNFKAAERDLFNYRNNAKVTTKDYLTYLSYQFDLPNPSMQTMETKYHLSKAFFTVRADFQQSNSLTQDAIHKDNFFDYGYIGEFKKYSTPVYAAKGNETNPSEERKMFIDQFGDTVYLKNYYELLGNADTAFKYVRAEINEERANITQSVFDYAQGRFDVNSQNLLSNLGLLNGNRPANVFGLWSSPGQVKSGYSKNQNTYVSFSAYGEATLNAPLSNKDNHPHDFQYGLFFEQSFQRGYSLSANDLWLLMPQLTNTHLSKLDKENPMLTYNSDGVFTDTVRYNRLIEGGSQTAFDKNLRAQLIAKGAKDIYGNPIDARSIINVNEIKPEQLSLDMFSADELINNGNSYVNYYGYDYLGNKVSNKTSIDKYLNDKQNRGVGAFQPTYIAAWIQDQFDFKDLIFRAGLRMERYDANQPVLADPYSLFPIKTAAEVKQLNGKDIEHPRGIAKDFKVYVDDVKNPTKVVGYRQGDQWYDAGGNQIANPDLLANQSSNGKIAPYLVNKEQEEIEANAFKDYEAKMFILPRFLFSFPLKNGLFFANYDVQTQRPSSAFSRGNISDYIFLENTNGGTIANPALHPRIKTSYEIGFTQTLFNPIENNGLYAGLGLVGGYANITNDINLFFYNQAYPISYTSYTNIDNSSIKNLRLDFTMSKSQNLTFRANYTLLYANGTGSNANSSRALIQSNQPNLRTNLPLGDLDVRNTFKVDMIYNFGGGLDPRTQKSLYIGPEALEKYLKYTTLSANFNAISGLPYTPTITPVQLGSTDRAQIKGNPFGSRLPYNYNLNLRVNKGFEISKKNGNASLLNVYILVSNVLNAKNPTSVYPFTGQATDDGFLSSPRGQQQITSAVNVEAYEAVYRAALQNPGFFRSPRMAQLGIRLSF